jgi:hypothetical protein
VARPRPSPSVPSTCGARGPPWPTNSPTSPPSPNGSQEARSQRESGDVEDKPRLRSQRRTHQVRQSATTLHPLTQRSASPPRRSRRALQGFRSAFRPTCRARPGTGTEQTSRVSNPRWSTGALAGKRPLAHRAPCRSRPQSSESHLEPFRGNGASRTPTAQAKADRPRGISRRRRRTKMEGAPLDERWWFGTDEVARLTPGSRALMRFSVPSPTASASSV